MQVTIGEEQLEATPEQVEAVRALFAPKQEGWVPKNDEVYFWINIRGDVCDAIFDNDEIDNMRGKQNNMFPIKEQCKAEVKRREGSVRRYLPKNGEEYKTVDLIWDIMIDRWMKDTIDVTAYHNGMVWHKDTPDEVILAWVKEYRSAWETV